MSDSPWSEVCHAKGCVRRDHCEAGRCDLKEMDESWTPHPNWEEREHPHTSEGRSFDLCVGDTSIYVHTPMNVVGMPKGGWIGGGPGGANGKRHHTLGEAMRAAEAHLAIVFHNRIRNAARDITAANAGLEALHQKGTP